MSQSTIDRDAGLVCDGLHELMIRVVDMDLPPEERVYLITELDAILCRALSVFSPIEN
jgi:hypothetical protein